MAEVEPQGGEDPSDPQRSGHSLANLWELVSGCLDACEAKSVAEIGAFAGDLTRRLLDWAEPTGARVTAIDPFEHPWLVKLAKERPDLDLVAELSHDALSHIPLPDAVIVDGDHNYFTVSEELRVIAERAPEGDLPLLLFHDACWPHGRRDAYWAPDRIPPEHRQPLGTRATLFPGNPGTAEEGLVLPKSAAQEGGPRNGVLTAIEDFVADRPGLRMAVVPAFFGFAAVWHVEAPWAGAVAEILDPWDRNPTLARLEANRVFNVATSSARVAKLRRLEKKVEELRSLNQRQEKLIRELSGSGRENPKEPGT